MASNYELDKGKTPYELLKQAAYPESKYGAQAAPQGAPFVERRNARPISVEEEKDAVIRKFSTGATRDTDASKPDYEGFLSPWVIKRYGEYMNKNRVQPDGSVRASDNWQLGIPVKAYMQSLWRHVHDVWMGHRHGMTNDSQEDALCAVLFNTSGYLHELLKARDYYRPSEKKNPYAEKESPTSSSPDQSESLREETAKASPSISCECGCGKPGCFGKLAKFGPPITQSFVGFPTVKGHTHSTHPGRLCYCDNPHW